MKITKLTIENVGIIEHEEINFDKPLVIFFGDVMNGKTTILNAVKLCFNSKIPDEIIRKGADKAQVCLEFENGSITRKIGLGKNGYIDNMTVIINGKSVGKKGLKDFVNPFQLDQDFFIDMKTEDRKKYLINLFGIDTVDIDNKILKQEQDNQVIRAEIKAMGEINPVKAEKVDVVKLSEKLVKIKQEDNEIYEQFLKQKDHRDHLIHRKDLCRDHLKKCREEAKVLRDQLEILKKEEDKLLSEINEMDIPDEPVEPTPNNTFDLEAQIKNAEAQNQLYHQYQDDLKRIEEKQNKESELKNSERNLAVLRVEKKKMLNDIDLSEKVPGLHIDDDGKMMFEGTALSMISDSQEMRLSTLLSSLYPDCFGVELIDRGESLGKSVFDLVERAKEKERTILVTVVKDEPAQSTEEIGTYWVENGKLNQE